MTKYILLLWSRDWIHQSQHTLAVYKQDRASKVRIFMPDHTTGPILYKGPKVHKGETSLKGTTDPHIGSLEWALLWPPYKVLH